MLCAVKVNHGIRTTFTNFPAAGRRRFCDKLTRSVLLGQNTKAYSTASVYSTSDSLESAQMMLNGFTLIVAAFAAFYMARRTQVRTAQLAVPRVCQDVPVCFTAF
jgi:hypothetical protein